MEIGAHSASGSGDEAPSRGRWRVRLIPIAILAALAAGALLYGPAAVGHFLIKTTRDRYTILGVTQVERVTRVHRLGGLPHGVQEEWYWTGFQKSRSTYDRGKLLESVHWSQDGLLDGWRLPGGGVEVSWEGGLQSVKVQTRVRPSIGGKEVIVEWRFGEVVRHREYSPGFRPGYYTSEEIIEIVRAYNASAPGPRGELVEPPIRAPRRAGRAGAEGR